MLLQRVLERRWQGVQAVYHHGGTRQAERDAELLHLAKQITQHGQRIGRHDRCTLLSAPAHD
jgi:hypothetical protein